MSTSRISSLKQPPCYFSLTITVSSNDNLSALASELNPATVLRLPIVFFVYRRRVPSNGGELMGLESLEMLITDQKVGAVIIFSTFFTTVTVASSWWLTCNLYIRISLFLGPFLVFTLEKKQSFWGYKFFILNKCFWLYNWRIIVRNHIHVL